MIVVPDAGPLIYLAGAGHLDLLRALYVDMVVPRVVFDEVTVAGAGLTGSAEDAAATWTRVVQQAPDATLLVDDGEARAVASERGIPVVGSLGVLLAAKQRGHLAAVGPVLDRMVELGMFVSPALRARVLSLAGQEEQ